MQVNKIREVPGHESILVTHTDAPEVLVWSLERQPNRANDKARIPYPIPLPIRTYTYILHYTPTPYLIPYTHPGLQDRVDIMCC